MSDVFAKLGLDADATVEEIAQAIVRAWGSYEQAQHKAVALLTAYGQREREAGERALWAAYCPECVHCCKSFEGERYCGKLCMSECEPELPPCVTDDGCEERKVSFDICPLRGKKGGA